MKSPIYINILYWLIHIFYWVFVLAIGLFVLSHILSFWGLGFDFAATIALPIDKSLIDVSSLLLNGVEIPVKISNTMAIVNLADLNLDFQIITGVVMVLGIAVIVYSLNRLRKLINNVRENIVFEERNVVILNQVAYSLFIFWLLEDIIFKIYKIWYFEISHFSFDLVEVLLANYLVVGLIILAIAYIFKRGVQLQNEQNLTI